MKIEDLIDPQGDKEALMTKAPREMEMVMENPMEMVAQVVMVIQMGVEVQVKMEIHPEEGKNLLEESGGDDEGSSPSDDDGGGDGSSSPSSDTTPPRRRRHRRPRFVYVVQGPPGPPGQMGQPGQAGRDGRDGQAPQLTRALEETLRAQRGNLDTTGLENSFDYFGKTMTEVLNAQQRANRNLEEQFGKANETQESQVEAMQDMAQVNYQMKFDHMFASVPIYDGTDPDSFDWLYQIESLCELSKRDVRIS